MKTLLLAAGAFALALTAGQALAAKHHAAASAAVAGPTQPVPYAQLDAYLKASPKQRATKDWWSGAQASTGAAANTSAVTTAGADASASSSAAPPLPATPPVDTTPSSEPTPPPTAATPAAPVNPPPK